MNTKAKKKRVAIVGAGPGGLTAAMLLAHHGYDVQVYERNAYVGGRTSSFTMEGYTFDLGPTFLMMKHILEEIFEFTGRDMSDYMQLAEIDPLYRLVYGDSGKAFYPTRDREKMKDQIRRVFPGNEEGYDRFFEYEKPKYERLVPCLQVPYEKYTDLLSPRMVKALPYLDAHKNLFQHLGRYFDDDDLKIAFTFQAKYLGMSPWNCPALFSLIGYLEHGLGIYHPLGGLNQISVSMARAAEEDGAVIHLNAPVKEVLVEGGRATGLLLESGERVEAHDVVLNADFAYAMRDLVDERHRPKYTDRKLSRMKYSCSTFMLYLGVDKVYDIPHHNIIFSNDYKQNVDEIADIKVMSDDPSVYVQNACVTDPSLAPEGKSTLYVLVPVANNKSAIDWDREAPAFRDKVLDLMEERGGLTGIRDHIEVERVVTPKFWDEQYNVYLGATFNLAHNLGQMLMWRPHNRFEQIDNCWLTGGGTHPGSGLPTIVESGRISAGLILERDAWYLER